MSDVHAEAGLLKIVLHDDDDTPMAFVVELLHSVFKKPIAEALEFTEKFDKYGQVTLRDLSARRCRGAA